MQFPDLLIIAASTHEAEVSLIKVCCRSKFWSWNVFQRVEKEIVNDCIAERAYKEDDKIEQEIG
jgi:hypothetical protein